jgi:hypothetical protein
VPMGVATALMDEALMDALADEALMAEVALPEAVDPDGTETGGITPDELAVCEVTAELMVADDCEMLSDETELVESTLLPVGSTVFPDDNEMLSDVGEPVGDTLAPDDSVPDEVRPDTVALPEGRTLPEGDTLLSVGSAVPDGTETLPVGEALAPEDERVLEGSVPEESESDASTLLDEKAEVPEDRLKPDDGLIDAPVGSAVAFADWLIEPPDGKDDVVVSPRILESKSVGTTAVADKLLDNDTDAEINGGALTLDDMLLDVPLVDVPSGNASQTSTALLPPPDWVLLPVLGVVHSGGVLSANAVGSVFPQ